jgi:hypothetical protein
MDTNLKKKLHKEASNGEEPKLTLHLRGLLGDERKRQREQDSRASTLSPPLHNSKEKESELENNRAEAEQGQGQVHHPQHSGLMLLCRAAQQMQEGDEEKARAALILVGMWGDRRGV